LQLHVRIATGGKYMASSQSDVSSLCTGFRFATVVNHTVFILSTVTNQMVQINSVIKSIKTISTPRFRSDSSNLKQRENYVKLEIMK
jgi:hypothetical protein